MCASARIDEREGTETLPYGIANSEGVGVADGSNRREDNILPYKPLNNPRGNGDFAYYGSNTSEDSAKSP